MEGEPIMDCVCVGSVDKEIKALFFSQDSQRRNAAHNYIINLDRLTMPTKLTLSFQLLQFASSPESLMFGANTLYKIITEDNSFMAEIAPLMQNLTRALLDRTDILPDFVISKLCSCLALVSILVSQNDSFSAVTSIVAEIDVTLRSTPQKRASVLFAFLGSIATEKVDNRRTLGNLDLRKIEDQVARLVCDCVLSAWSSNESPALKRTALSCLRTWISSCRSIDPFSDIVVEISPGLRDDTLCTEVSDVLVECIEHPTCLLHSKFVGRILASVIESRHRADFTRSDTVRAFIAVIACIGRDLYEHIIQFLDDQALDLCHQLHDIALEFTVKPVDLSSDNCLVILDYWVGLTVYLINRGEPLESGSRLWIILCSLFQKCCSMIVHGDDASTVALSKADMEKFEELRHAIRKLLPNCFVLLSQDILNFTVKSLQDLTRGVPTPWQQVEALLFFIRGISESLSRRDMNVVPAVVAALPGLPSHPRVRGTAIQLLHDLREWLEEHPDYLPPVLVFLSGCIDTGLHTSPALSTIEGVCLSTIESIPSEMCQQLGQRLAEACYSGVMPSDLRPRCMQVVGVLLKGFPHSSLRGFVTQLAAWMGSEMASSTQLGPDRLLPVLRCTVSLMEGLSLSSFPDAHPSTLLLDVSVRALQATVSAPSVDSNVAESVCRLIDLGLVGGAEYLLPLLVMLLEMVGTLLVKTLEAPALNSSINLVLLFLDHQPSWEILCLYVCRLYQTSISLMGRCPDLSDHAEFVSSYFRLVAKFTKVQPLLWSACGDDTLLEHTDLAIRALAVADNSVVRSVCAYLCLIILDTDPRPEQWENGRGQLMVCSLLSVVLCTQVNCDPVADVVLAFVLHKTPVFDGWLGTALSPGQIPSKHITQTEASAFHQQVMRTRVSRRRMLDILKGFRKLTTRSRSNHL